MGPEFSIICILLLSAYASADAQQQTEESLVQLNENNWDLMLTGEWMIEL